MNLKSTWSALEESFASAARQSHLADPLRDGLKK